MKIAFVLFDGMTSMDFVGFYDEVLPDLGSFNLVFLPGGLSTRRLRYDETFIDWIQTAKAAQFKVSVCTGALLWGAAGFLTGKKATTNASAFELLASYDAEVVEARVVRDGDMITGGGVTAAIDAGLYMIEWLTDASVARQVQQKLEYPYYRAGNLGEIYYAALDANDTGAGGLP